MKNAAKKVELPLVEPIYKTFQYQSAGSAILAGNPSVQNWYLNEIMILSCGRRFLNGFTSPEVGIADSTWNSNPYLIKRWYLTQFLGGYAHIVIRKLLDEGFYVYFTGVDDYYVEGKSWYHERHFNHDGCICGYNQEDKTYCIYSYDKNWVCRKFWTPQKSFDRGMKAMHKKGFYGGICGLKPTDDQVPFSPQTALEKIAQYLDSDLDKYPETEAGTAYGIVVHDYTAKYLDKLYDGSVPHERMDRRVFRMIWEHKKAMLQRIELIEDELKLDNFISEAYKTIVREADNCRMLYAAHHMKQRNAVLPTIRKKLLAFKEKELELLSDLLQKTKGLEPK